MDGWVEMRSRCSPDVTNEINSETHSCTHSLASLLILAVEGTAFFIKRETFAIYVQKERGGR